MKYFGKNFIYNAKSKFLLFFQDQMYIFGYKTTVFIQNMYILVKFFGKNFIFRVKSKNFWVFGTKRTFLGTKLVFIQNLYILVKYFGKNFIFSVKSTIFLFFLGPNVHFRVQNYTFYPKFVHFSEIFWQKRHL